MVAYRGGMVVKSSVEFHFGLDLIRAQMWRSPESWLRPLLMETLAESRMLEVELGLQHPVAQKPLCLELQAPKVEEKVVSIPLRVSVEDREGGRGGFDSVLTAVSSGDQRTKLEVTGHYEPPAEISPSQRVLLQSVLEVLSRHFLSRVASELSERVIMMGSG